MSGFIGFLVIAIAWAVFGSLKAAADRVGKDTKPGARPTISQASQRKPAPTPVKSSVTRSEPRDNRSMQKRNDLLPDFGDTVEIEKPLRTAVKSEEIIRERPREKEKLDLAPLFKGDRLAEAIILAECLDRPRAYRPHPLNKQQNMLQRRG